MRKDKQLIAGFGATLVGLVGVMTIWLPNYSPWAAQARERAGRNRAAGVAQPSGLNSRSASMWKNLDKEKRENDE